MSYLAYLHQRAIERSLNALNGPGALTRDVLTRSWPDCMQSGLICALLWTATGTEWV